MVTTKKAPPFIFPPAKVSAGKAPAKAPAKAPGKPAPAMKKGKC